MDYQKEELQWLGCKLRFNERDEGRIVEDKVTVAEWGMLSELRAETAKAYNCSQPDEDK